MKLQAQYNKITIISTVFILLVAAVGYYFLLEYVLINQLDEALKVEEVEIHDYIKKHNKLPDATVYKDQRIAFENTEQAAYRGFKSLQAFHPGENKMESSRQLLFTVEVAGQKYMASVTKSEEATEHLVWIILFTTIILIVLLTVILFFSNRFLVKKLWQPFYNTLTSIKEFNLSAPVTISLHPTQITEFRELNESIRMMALKVLKDYQSLKDFTDHASHEIQTPLAVINSKLDVLIQEPELSEKSMSQIQGIYTALQKLAPLSQSLLLLTKIENNQFPDIELILMDEMLAEKNFELQNWLHTMNLKIDVRLDPLKIKMNGQLAEIMVSNLLRNAVNHSEAGDTIFIHTGDNRLIISNSGKASLDKSRIFDRFYKSDDSQGSGLGLAIVHQICEQYGFKLTYEFAEAQHQFSIFFTP